MAFIQSLVSSFWRKWTHTYFPSLMVQQIWHHTRRNIAADDIVIIHDKNVDRGQWKLGKVVNTILGNDGIIRRVEAQYKNKDSLQYTHVFRSVQRLIVILPFEEQLQ